MSFVKAVRNLRYAACCVLTKAPLRGLSPEEALREALRAPEIQLEALRALGNDSEPIEGIYQKFWVSRTDGSSRPGGKHAQCTYFVLDWEHDPFAIPAALAYADACEAAYPQLAADLRTKARYAQRVPRRP